MTIDTVTIVGLGAMGSMYASFFLKALPPESVRVVADARRRQRYQCEGIFVNGKRIDRQLVYVDPKTAGDPADLVIFATKYNQLAQAMEDAANQVGPDTTVISVLNGVVSEGDLALRYGVEKVLLCVAQEMDAMHVHNRTTYKNMGRLAVGMLGDDPRTVERLEAVEDFFYDIEFPFWEPSDIQHTLWSKLMVNVGQNQTCMVYNCTYGDLAHRGEERDTFVGAMHETMLVAQAEGVNLTGKDVQQWLAVVARLDPRGIPSMKQDADAHRKSEVALFGGTVISLGRKHGIPTPVNEMLVKRIREIESQY